MLIHKKVFLSLLAIGALCISTQSLAAECPALQGPGVVQGAGPQPNPANQEAILVQQKMKEVVQALQQNRQTADLLLQAAKAAGASPQALNDMEQMANGFRQTFMSAVSPQQIIEAIISDSPELSQGLVITAPDGSKWSVMPMNKPAPQKPGNKAPGNVPPNAPINAPAPIAPDTSMSNSANAPVANAPQEIIIMEETVSDMPFWPTKDHLGKDGVLKYLEKRNSAQPGQN